MPFVKLDCGILDSSLWAEDPHVRLTFLTMLAMAEADGLCRATAPGIARRGNLAEPEVRAALERLEAPDPDDRSGVDEGRRIRRVAGGYFVTNYAAYRNRDYTATERKRRQRERERVVTGNSPGEPASPPNPLSNEQKQTQTHRSHKESQPSRRDNRDEEASPRTVRSDRQQQRRTAAASVHPYAEPLIRLFNVVFGKRLRGTPGNLAMVSEPLAAGYAAADIAGGIVAAAWGPDRWYRDPAAGNPDLEILLRHKGGTNPKTGQAAKRHLDALIGLAGQLDVRGKAGKLAEFEAIVPGLSAALRGSPSPETVSGETGGLTGDFPGEVLARLDAATVTT